MSFCDINKESEDFFKNDFPSNLSFEASVTGPTKNNLTLEASRDEKNVNASLKPKFVFQDYGLETKATLSSSGTVKGEFVLTDKITKGLKLTGSVEEKKTTNVSGSVQYTHEKFVFKTTFNSELFAPKPKTETKTPTPKTPTTPKTTTPTPSTTTTTPSTTTTTPSTTTTTTTTTPSTTTPSTTTTPAVKTPETKYASGCSCLLFTKNEYSVGGLVKYELGTKSHITEAAFGGRYRNDRYSGVLRVVRDDTNNFNIDGGVVYHLQSTKGDLSAKFNVPIQGDSPTLDFGLLRVNDDSSWKVKVSSTGNAGVSYTQNWNKNTKFTSAVEFSLVDPKKSKAGVQVKFTD